MNPTTLWDRNQVLLWAHALGKKPSDINLRVFNSSEDAHPQERKKFTAGYLRTLGDEWFTQKYDVYAVVNDGGQEKNNITEVRALFAEHDDLAKGLPEFANFNKETASDEEFAAYSVANKRLSTELVQGLVEAGKLPKPTMCVDTGGKSLHWYWRLADGHTNLTKWGELQERLILLLGSDPTIKDLPRIMRLPGFLCSRTGKPATILSTESDFDDDFEAVYVSYTMEQFDELLPALEVPEAPKKAHPLSTGTTPPKLEATGAVAWFVHLDDKSKWECVNQMIAKIVEVHGREDRGGAPPHEIRMRFLPGIFREYTNKSIEDMYKLVTTHFEWSSKTYPGERGFAEWYKGLKVDGYFTDAVNIGSTIYLAKLCGFDSAPWREKAGVEPGSLAAIVAEELFGISNPADRHILTLPTGDTYIREGSNFYYTLLPGSVLENMVSGWLFTNMPKKFGTVDAVVKALRQLTAVPSRVAPNGYVLCTNGVLEIGKTEPKLHPYTSPAVQDMVFLDPPGTTYDPNADRTHARAVLGGLENDEAKEVWLRVAAQALDPSQLRSTPVALLNIGEGGNGKDVCADILKHIFGHNTTTNIDMSDLAKANDAAQNNGTLALLPLRTARLNLPPETTTKIKLDHIPALKQVVTCEWMKARNHSAQYEAFRPRAIHMFSVNEAVLADSNSAMDRRFRAVKWPYQYKFDFEIDHSNPFHKPAVAWYRPSGEDEAGQERVRREIAPGMLLELVEAFYRLTGVTPSEYGSGVPVGYSLQVRADMRASTDHVKEFLMEMNFERDTEKVSAYSVNVTDMWYLYRLWCLENGRAELRPSTQGSVIDMQITMLREDKDSCQTPTALTRRIEKAENIKVVKVGSRNRKGLPPKRYWEYLVLPEHLRAEGCGMIPKEYI